MNVVDWGNKISVVDRENLKWKLNSCGCAKVRGNLSAL